MNTTVAKIHRLDSPSKTNMNWLQEWLRDSKGGMSALQKDTLFAWDKSFGNDFLTFHTPPPDHDFFTEWITARPISFYHALWGRQHRRSGGRVIDEETGLVDYSEGRLSKTTKMISITIASTIPMIAILGLYFEKDLLRRIYIAIGITAAFALVLSAFTKARRIEIFMATIGLAAVQVVFIGNAERKS